MHVEPKKDKRDEEKADKKRPVERASIEENISNQELSENDSRCYLEKEVAGYELKGDMGAEEDEIGSSSFSDVDSF